MPEFFLQITIFLPLALAAIGFLFWNKANSWLWSSVALSTIFIFLTHTWMFLEALAVTQKIVPGVGAYPWSGFWNINTNFATDALNSPFLWVTSLVFMVVVLVGRERLNGGKIISLMLLEFGVLGMYASSTLFSFLFFSALCIVPATFLIGTDGSTELKRLSKPFMLISTISIFLLLVCFFILYPEFYSAVEVGSKKYLIFALLSGVFFIKMIPFHWLLRRLSSAKNLILLLPVMTVYNFGLYAFLRFLFPDFSNEFMEFQFLFFIVGLVSMLLPALLLLRCTSLRDQIVLFQQIFSGLIFLGISSGNKEGFVGALMMGIFLFLILAAIFTIIDISERGSKDGYLGNAPNNPKLLLFSVYTMLAAFCLPVSFGFHSTLLIFYGLTAKETIFVFPIVLFLALLLVVSCYRSLSPVFHEEYAKERAPLLRLHSWDALCCFFMGGCLVLLTIYPRLLSRYFSYAVSEALNLLGGG